MFWFPSPFLVPHSPSPRPTNAPCNVWFFLSCSRPSSPLRTIRQHTSQCYRYALSSPIPATSQYASKWLVFPLYVSSLIPHDTLKRLAIFDVPSLFLVVHPPSPRRANMPRDACFSLSSYRRSSPIPATRQHASKCLVFHLVSIAFADAGSALKGRPQDWRCLVFSPLFSSLIPGTCQHATRCLVFRFFGCCCGRNFSFSPSFCLLLLSPGGLLRGDHRAKHIAYSLYFSRPSPPRHANTPPNAWFSPFCVCLC